METWATLPGGKVVRCERGIPPTALYVCREGDGRWTPRAEWNATAEKPVPRPVKVHEPEPEDDDESLKPGPDHAARFAIWIARYPQVYKAFVEIALRECRSGKRHIGSKAIVEEIRFKRAECADVNIDMYRVNNIYTPYLARKAVEEHPELRGAFEFREREKAS